MTGGLPEGKRILSFGKNHLQCLWKMVSPLLINRWNRVIQQNLLHKDSKFNPWEDKHKQFPQQVENPLFVFHISLFSHNIRHNEFQKISFASNIFFSGKKPRLIYVIHCLVREDYSLRPSGTWLQLGIHSSFFVQEFCE